MKSILLFLLLSLIAVSCSKKEEKTKASQHLSLNLNADPDSLDPRCVRMLKDITIVKHLFEGLMRLDHDGMPKPAMASSVEISADGLTYVFHLRETKWTNQEKVTSLDFIHAWKSVLDPTFPTDYAHILFPIKNAKLAKMGKCSLDEVAISAPDDQTLMVTLENPTPYFLELMSFPTSFPVCSTIDLRSKDWSYPPAKNFVSNGPFALQSWEPDRQLELVKNETYWEENKVSLLGIRFYVTPDNLTESFLYEKGELDWLGQPLSNSMSSELLQKMKQDGNLNSYPIAGTFWLKFNVSASPFDQKKIRQAFSYALCREKIITHILHGRQKGATGILPPTMSLQTEPLFEDGDVSLAKRLFNEALKENHWDERTFPKITLTYVPVERNSKIVQLVADEWKKIFNINVVLEAVENKTFRQNCKLGKFQVGTGDWIADYNDPLAFLELFKYSLSDKDSNGLNDTRWNDETYSALLDQAMQEASLERRKEFLREAEKIIVEAMPVIPLYHYSFDYVKKNEIEEVVFSPGGAVDFKYAKKAT